MDSPARRRLRVRLSIGRAVFFRRSGRPRARGPTRSRARRRTTAAATRSRRSSRAQQERRGAPARARDAGRLLADRQHGRRRHRPAGRTVRRPALHAVQGADGASSSPSRCRAITACRPSRSSGSTPRITTGKKSGRVRCSTTTLTPRSVSLPARPGVEPAPVATVAPRRVHPRRARRDRTPAAPHRIPRLARWPACGAPTRPASAWPTRSAAGWKSVLGDRGLVVYDSSDPASKPLVEPGVRARAVDAGADGRSWRRSAGSDLTARGYHAQVHAQDDSLALFHLDGGRRADPPAGRPLRRRRPAVTRAPALVAQATDAAGRLQPERAAASDRAGHDLSDDLLRRRPERARVSRPAARRLRALRRADAADVSARDGDAARFGRAALPDEVQAAARSAAGAGRGGAERAAEDADSAGRRRVVHRGGAGDRRADDAASSRRCRRSIRRSKAPRARRSSGCSTICRRCTAR